MPSKEESSSKEKGRDEEKEVSRQANIKSPAQCGAFFIPLW